MTQFASAGFAAADGTELSAADANFTKLLTGADNAIITSNRVRRVIPGGATAAAYRHTATPPSADYQVSCDLYIVGTTSTTFNGGPMARCVAGALTGYWARWRNGTGIQLFRYNAATATQLGSTVTQSQSAGSTLRLTLKCEGSVISVYRNAETTPIISVTDGSPLSSVGYAGLLAATDSTTDGVHLDNFSADTLSSPASVATSATIAAPAFSGSVSVSPVVSSSASAALPAFSGSITSGDFSVEFDFTPPLPGFSGSISVSPAVSATTTVSLPAFSGSITIATGGATITITDLKDLTTGTLRASETGVTAIINAVDTGELVALLSGQTSTAGGDMSLSHASLLAATEYRVTVVLSDGSEGTWKYTAA